MAASSQERPDLLDSVLKAHGGLERWSQIKSIDLTWNFSGWLLAVKGYPAHYQPTITIDTKKQVAILRRLGSGPDDKFMFTPERTWIEQRDGSISMSRDNPRASFAGHVRTTPWDDLHLTYFVGYALYNYLVTPFCFTWPGFQTRELPEHEERGQRWRVLEVTYPDSFATHTKVQKFYFNDKFMLQRLDYVTDVAGGVVAHYCFDHKEVGGIVFPMLRRVVRRVPETNEGVVGGPSSFTLDYCELSLKEVDGKEIMNRGAYGDLVPSKTEINYGSDWCVIQHEKCLLAKRISRERLNPPSMEADVQEDMKRTNFVVVARNFPLEQTFGGIKMLEKI